MIAAPPFETGAVQEIKAVVDDEVAAATTEVGAPGVVAGIAAAEAADAALVPAPLVAVTVKV